MSKELDEWTELQLQKEYLRGEIAGLETIRSYLLNLSGECFSRHEDDKAQLARAFADKIKKDFITPLEAKTQEKYDALDELENTKARS